MTLLGYTITVVFTGCAFGISADAPETLSDWCYNPPGDDCTWYRKCLVARYPCEAANDSYAIGFAETICEAFGTSRSEFSEQGQNWVDKTRACLQKQLVPLLSMDKDMTCPDIQHFAYQTHTTCYLDPDVSGSTASPTSTPTFCSLPFSDWFRILWLVKHSFVRETSETVKQATQILGSCIGGSNLFG